MNHALSHTVLAALLVHQMQLLKGRHYARLSKSIFTMYYSGASLEYYYAAPQFSLCLKQTVSPLDEPTLLIHQLPEANYLQRLCKQTIEVGFYLIFKKGNFSNICLSQSPKYASEQLIEQPQQQPQKQRACLTQTSDIKIVYE